jgi:hypothetical protein
LTVPLRHVSFPLGRKIVRAAECNASFPGALRAPESEVITLVSCDERPGFEIRAYTPASSRRLHRGYKGKTSTLLQLSKCEERNSPLRLTPLPMNPRALRS